tara:strand:+ start:243 stop:407 length:165 start_codon:yes stop_codon:yes gene_type:complete
MGTFFAKDKKSAVKRLREIEKKEGTRFSPPKLAKKQIPHISKWRTFKTKRVDKK